MTFVLVGISILVLTVGFFVLAAYRFAYSMTTFTENGVRTPRPHDMTPWQRLGVLINGVTIPKPPLDRLPTDLGFAYHEHRTTTQDGTSIAMWELPHESPRGTVILYHGYTVAKSFVLDEAQAIHRLGYHVWLVDFRGSGDSDGLITTIGWHEWQDVAASVAYVIDTVPPRPLVVYGQSMGGAAILHAQSREPLPVNGLILEAVYTTLETTARRRCQRLGLPAWPVAPLLLHFGSRLRNFDAHALRPIDFATAVTQPTLVIHGAEDRNVTQADTDALVSQLAGPTTATTILGSGHECIRKGNPEAWDRAVDDWLVLLETVDR